MQSQARLYPGEVTVCSGSYYIAQEDIDAGEVHQYITLYNTVGNSCSSRLTSDNVGLPRLLHQMRVMFYGEELHKVVRFLADVESYCMQIHVRN